MLARLKVILGLLALISALGAPARSPGAGAVLPSLGAEYTRPHLLIDVGEGRKINLVCLGSGSPTVLFDSGMSDWSNTWALIQPEIAKSVRACSYDRAGMGYSEPASSERTPFEIVQDMRALLKGVGAQREVVLVGHSLGGFNAKLYAALYPDDVVGVVLVDPGEERKYDRGRDELRTKFGVLIASRLELAENDFNDALLRKFEKCAADATVSDLDPSSAAYDRCTDPIRTQLGAAILAERPNIQKKMAYQATQASELRNSVFVSSRGDAVYSGLFRPSMFGTKPLIVLTSDRYDHNNPLAVANHFLSRYLHTQTAALSRRGVERLVPDTGHDIQVERPQAVIDAIKEVLRTLRRR